MVKTFTEIRAELTAVLGMQGASKLKKAEWLEAMAVAYGKLSSAEMVRVQGDLAATEGKQALTFLTGHLNLADSTPTTVEAEGATEVVDAKEDVDGSKLLEAVTVTPEAPGLAGYADGKRAKPVVWKMFRAKGDLKGTYFIKGSGLVADGLLEKDLELGAVRRGSEAMLAALVARKDLFINGDVFEVKNEVRYQVIGGTVVESAT